MLEKIILIGAGVVAFLIVVAFAFMMDSVEPTEYGMTYNVLTKTAGMDHIYEGGLYFLGPVQRFIKFPATVTHIEFSDSPDAHAVPLETRTKEGLGLILHVAFQYKLYREDIPKLYKLTNVRYEETFIRQAKNVILEQASEYNAPEYWEKRSEIGTAISKKLNQTLSTTYTSVIAFQMIQIDLPTSYEDSIVQTQVEVQRKETKRYEQKATTMRESINVDVSEADKKAQIIFATADATAIRIINQAKSEAINNTIYNEKLSYKHAGDLLGLDATSGLIDYIQLLNIMKNQESQLIVGMKNSLINIQTPAPKERSDK
jgi:regulator of protease activity HflC (stomatin/prohibitin superfamily)